jgi:hypothetical protein
MSALPGLPLLLRARRWKGARHGRRRGHRAGSLPEEDGLGLGFIGVGLRKKAERRGARLRERQVLALPRLPLTRNKKTYV